MISKVLPATPRSTSDQAHRQPQRQMHPSQPSPCGRVGSRPIWSRTGVESGSVWRRTRIDSGLMWGRAWADLGSFAVDVGPSWGGSGVDRVRPGADPCQSEADMWPICGRLVADPGSIWHRSGIGLALSAGLRSIWGRSGVDLRSWRGWHMGLPFGDTAKSRPCPWAAGRRGAAATGSGPAPTSARLRRRAPAPLASGPTSEGGGGDQVPKLVGPGVAQGRPEVRGQRGPTMGRQLIALMAHVVWEQRLQHQPAIRCGNVLSHHRESVKSQL